MDKYALAGDFEGQACPFGRSCCIGGLSHKHRYAGLRYHYSWDDESNLYPLAFSTWPSIGSFPGWWCTCGCTIVVMYLQHTTKPQLKLYGMSYGGLVGGISCHVAVMENTKCSQSTTMCSQWLHLAKEQGSGGSCCGVTSDQEPKESLWHTHVCVVCLSCFWTAPHQSVQQPLTHTRTSQVGK